MCLLPAFALIQSKPIAKSMSVTVLLHYYVVVQAIY